MCVLCGDLVADPHWSEHATGGETERRQARYRRVRIVNRVLTPYLLAVHEDLSGTRYVVADRKGKSEVVRSLAELWPAADRLVSAPLDPLDGRLLAALEGVSAR